MADEHDAAGDKDSGQTIEIAFAMAGAISAGAWIAGVLDHIRESLDAFEHWRLDETDPDRPKHRVVIKVLAGTSGGGMSAALFTAMLAGDPPAGKGWRSPLHHAWVEAIDIEKLLTMTDLDGLKRLPKNKKDTPQKPRSILNSEPLDQIRDEVFSLTPKTGLPAWVAPEMHLFITCTNLRGVGYRMTLAGGAPHEMSLHADYAHFVLANKVPSGLTADARHLDPAKVGAISGQNKDLAWEFLGETALASGAFPVGLAARKIARPIADYSAREWPVPRETPNNNNSCVDIGRLDPIAGPNDDPWQFLSVDGGVMNNEPLDLARRQLANGGRNPRCPTRARRVVVLIDPFPDPVDLEPRKPDILSVFWATFRALISQARFKPEEMLLAMDDRTASRFAITPSRQIGNKRAKNPLFSSIFGGFGGFLHRDIREHDYQLGRRNAEKFLKDWFRLAQVNPVFQGWQGNGVDPKPQKMIDAGGNKVACLPIIPSRDTFGREIEPTIKPTLARLDTRLRSLEGDGLNRIKRVLAETLPLPKWIFKGAWSLYVRGKAKNALFDRLTEDYNKTAETQ